MNTLFILVLLDYIDDLSTVIYNVLTITFLALTQKDLAILSNHIKQNIFSYLFTLIVPLVQASLYLFNQENSIILIVLVALTVLKKWGSSQRISRT